MKRSTWYVAALLTVVPAPVLVTSLPPSGGVAAATPSTAIRSHIAPAVPLKDPGPLVRPGATPYPTCYPMPRVAPVVPGPVPLPRAEPPLPAVPMPRLVPRLVNDCDETDVPSEPGAEAPELRR